MTKDQTPSREEVIAWAEQAGIKIYDQFKSQQEALLIGFAALAYAAGAEAERETIMDEWWMCVQSDLENGVKSLNECASEKWRKEYPEISKFAATIEARKENT